MGPTKRPNKTSRQQLRQQAKQDYPEAAILAERLGWSLRETPGWCDYVLKSNDGLHHIQLFPASGLKGYGVNYGGADLSSLRPGYRLHDAVTLAVEQAETQADREFRQIVG